jgi:death-on-curing protein
MRYLTLGEVLDLYQQVMQHTGGAIGVRDLNALESAIAQPRMTFGGEELYPTLVEKASALSFSLVMNHPFVDGNKRAGHAAMETFLVLNGFEIKASVGEQEQILLRLAAGEIQRDAFTEWLRAHLSEKS